MITKRYSWKEVENLNIPHKNGYTLFAENVEMRPQVHQVSTIQEAIKLAKQFSNEGWSVEVWGDEELVFAIEQYSDKPLTPESWHDYFVHERRRP